MSSKREIDLDKPSKYLREDNPDVQGVYEGAQATRLQDTKVLAKDILKFSVEFWITESGKR